jgi:hypothetical protein
MRKSSAVPLTILAAAALAVTGCHDHRDCVDAQGHKLPDSTCDGGYYGAHYIYGGSSGGHVGDTVVGGSVSRGGFGGIGGGDSAGGE